MAYVFDSTGVLKRPTAEELTAADEQSVVVVLDRGLLEDGSPYWAYVAVMPSKYAEFMRLASERTPLVLEEFGAIIRHGFEQDVPAAVKEAMKQEVGFDENLLDTILKDVTQAQAEHMKRAEAQRLSDIVQELKKQGSST